MEEKKYTVEFTEEELDALTEAIELVWNDGHDDDRLSSAADKIIDQLNLI